MMSITRRFLSLMAPPLAGVALVLCAAPAMAETKPYLGEEVAIGNAKAKVTVVEYASASCPHCAAFNNEVFPAFKAKYIDSGKVRYVFRELLTPPIEFAAAGFLLARCTGEDKYLPALESLFQDQDRIYQSGDLMGGLNAIGKKFGLSEADVGACIRDPKAQQALQGRLENADKAGVESTPTFFINGVKKEGELTLAQLSEAIDPVLAAPAASAR